MKFRIMVSVVVGSLLVASPVMANNSKSPLLKHPVEIIKYCKFAAQDQSSIWYGKFGACVASEIRTLFPLDPAEG
jgi:hypothetical protein